MANHGQSACSSNNPGAPSLAWKNRKVSMKTTTKRVTAPKLPRNRIYQQSKAALLPPGANGKLHIRSILVPVDFSAPSVKALKYAAAFAERFGAKLTLIHIVEPMAMPDF